MEEATAVGLVGVRAVVVTGVAATAEERGVVAMEEGWEAAVTVAAATEVE